MSGFAPSRRSLLAAAMLAALPARAAKTKLKVGFVNPGRHGDAFWQMTARVMRAAARDLDIDLMMEWGERDRARIIALSGSILARQPDYMLVVNEYRTGVPIIEAAQRRGVPSLLLFSGLLDEDLPLMTGDGASLLLGSLTPDNVAAGCVMAQALIVAARRVGLVQADGHVHLLAIGGPWATPASRDRFQGLQQAVQADGATDLLDHVANDWNREEAHHRALALLRRQPRAAGFWCANDDMALGAMQAAAELGRQPGKDILFAGMNWQEGALEAIAEGGMLMSMGGHFLVGAWGLASLRDHHEGGPPPSGRMVELAAIDKAGVGDYRRRFAGNAWERLDYRIFRAGGTAGDLTVEPLMKRGPRPARS